MGKCSIYNSFLMHVQYTRSPVDLPSHCDNSCQSTGTDITVFVLIIRTDKLEQTVRPRSDAAERGV